MSRETPTAGFVAKETLGMATLQLVLVLRVSHFFHNFETSKSQMKFYKKKLPSNIELCSVPKVATFYLMLYTKHIDICTNLGLDIVKARFIFFSLI
jgi:hypothetical protein